MSGARKSRSVSVGGYVADFVNVRGVPCIQVHNTDSSWLVRVAYDGEMYSILDVLLREYAQFGDAESLEALKSIFLSWQMVTGISNGYYHAAVMMLAEVYADPSLLRGGFFSKKSRAFRKRVDALRDKFLAWSKEYKSLTDKKEASLDMEDEADADYAVRVLTGDESPLDEEEEEGENDKN